MTTQRGKSAAGAIDPKAGPPRPSEQEFDAECPTLTPNNFARLAFRMGRHQRQQESIADVDRSIRHDLGATRRNVQYEAFNLGHPVVDRDPGRPFIQLTSRFALYL
jgi:hypothetical protein